MQKLLQLKKDYERQGFHLQRLYKRRKRDQYGIMRSTLHLLREPVAYTNTNRTQNNTLTIVYEGGNASSQEEVYYYDGGGATG